MRPLVSTDLLDFPLHCKRFTGVHVTIRENLSHQNCQPEIVRFVKSGCEFKQTKITNMLIHKQIVSSGSLSAKP